MTGLRPDKLASVNGRPVSLPEDAVKAETAAKTSYVPSTAVSRRIPGASAFLPIIAVALLVYSENFRSYRGLHNKGETATFLADVHSEQKDGGKCECNPPRVSPRSRVGPVCRLASTPADASQRLGEVVRRSILLGCADQRPLRGCCQEPKKAPSHPIRRSYGRYLKVQLEASGGKDESL